MKEFAIYARLSFRGEDEESIKRQIALGQEWIRAHRFAPVEYVEGLGHHSARSEKARPKWKELKQDIAGDRLAGVWVADIARASRNVRDFLDFLDLCAKHQVILISDKEHIDTASAAGRMLVTVLCAFNQFYSDDLSERQRRRHAYRKARGETSGRPPAGLHLNKETHQLEPSGETYGDGKTYLDTIRRLAELYGRGLGTQRLAKQLNDEGYRLRSVKGAPRKCQGTRLYDALGSLETYAPFLDPDVYRRALLQREQRRNSRENGGQSINPPSLCRRTLYCSRCGRRLTNYHHIRRYKQPGHSEHYEWHGYRHPNTPDCELSDRLVNCAPIDRQVWDWLQRLNETTDEDLDRFLESRAHAQPEEQAQVQSAIARLEQRLRNLDLMLADGDFGEVGEAKTRYLELVAETERDLAAARDTRDRLDRAFVRYRAKSDFVELRRHIREILKDGANPDRNNEVLREVCEQIVLNLDDRTLRLEVWPELEPFYSPDGPVVLSYA